MTKALRSVARAFASRRAGIALLLAAVIAVYANALGASFQFDDFNVIVDYSAVHSLRAWLDALPAIRPLLKLTYALNWAVDKSPLGFHIFNLGCHLVSAVLVFCLARRLLEHSSHATVIALLAALLFALHPAQTEAVTYISGRSVALMAMFYLGAALSALDGRAYLRSVLSPLLFIAALLTKETAWTLPLAVLLLRGLRGEAWRDSWQRTRMLWMTLVAIGVFILATPAYRRLLQHVFSIRSLLENVALQVDGWWYLLTRPLLLRTNIDPDLSLAPSFDPVWWAKLVALALWAVVAWRSPSRWLRFASLWFALHLLPTNSLLPRNDIANDRQLYLALVGPVLALAAALVCVRVRWLRAALPALLILLCGVATSLRNRDYRDEISLWEATAYASPHKARVWNNLGYAYQLAGQHNSALAAYERALSLDPGHDRARINAQLLRDRIEAQHP